MIQDPDWQVYFLGYTLNGYARVTGSWLELWWHHDQFVGSVIIAHGQVRWPKWLEKVSET